MSNIETNEAPPAEPVKLAEEDRKAIVTDVVDQLKEMIPGIGTGPSDPPEDPPEGGGGPGGEANLTARQMLDRAFAMTAKALDKIPGPPAKEKTPTGPAPLKKPVSRGLKVLGWHDAD